MTRHLVAPNKEELLTSSTFNFFRDTPTKSYPHPSSNIQPTLLLTPSLIWEIVNFGTSHRLRASWKKIVCIFFNMIGLRVMNN